MFKWLGDYPSWVWLYKTTQSGCITWEPEIEWMNAVEDTRNVFRHANQLEF